MEGHILLNLETGQWPVPLKENEEEIVAFWEVIPCSWWMATTVLEEVYGPHLHV
jgi:hypothetical protein